VRHVGDLGNIDIQTSPYFLRIADHVAKLDGPYSVLGVSKSLDTSSSTLLTKRNRDR
jgi:hypothetical protein